MFLRCGESPRWHSRGGRRAAVVRRAGGRPRLSCPGTTVVQFDAFSAVLVVAVAFGGGAAAVAVAVLLLSRLPLTPLYFRRLPWAGAPRARKVGPHGPDAAVRNRRRRRAHEAGAAHHHTGPGVQAGHLRLTPSQTDALRAGACAPCRHHHEYRYCFWMMPPYSKHKPLL